MVLVQGLIARRSVGHASGLQQGPPLLFLPQSCVLTLRTSPVPLPLFKVIPALKALRVSGRTSVVGTDVRRVFC